MSGQIEVQISVFAVGRMKKGAEHELADRYFDRFSKLAPSLGLTFLDVHEIAESRLQTSSQRIDEEGNKLLESLPEGGRLIVLDERGKSISSVILAKNFETWRDAGTKHMTIALGGPDGHSKKVRERADLLLSFGAMTWPHQIARILLSEQLYRIATILSGHPYHRI